MVTSSSATGPGSASSWMKAHSVATGFREGVPAMRAAVCRSFGAPLGIEEARLRAPGPGEVVVRVAACGICHSDVAFIDGAWGGALPAVYGHEAAGVVAEAAPDAAAASQPSARASPPLITSPP